MTRTHIGPTVTKDKGRSGSGHHIPNLYNEFDQLFDQYRSHDWAHLFHTPEVVQPVQSMFTEGRLPKIDIIDRDKDLLLRAELPGVEKKDLDISMTDNSVTIKASSCFQDKEEKENYYRCEISQEQFVRAIRLPAEVNVEKVTTSFKDGVLELTAPKLEPSQRRTIKVD